MLSAREVGRQTRDVTDLALLNTWFRDRIRPFGFTTHAAGVLQDGGASSFLLLDWPRSWLELYAANGFGADDCTIPLALADPAPFTWTEVQRRQPGVSARVFAAAAECGWRDGLVVPVHRDDGSRGLIVLAAPALDLTPEARSHVILLAQVAFERALEISAAPGPRPLGLSERQRSALNLVASGSTDDDVATSLGVSKATAAFHLQAARARLGAKTRAHAVAIAIAHGLI